MVEDAPRTREVSVRWQSSGQRTTALFVAAVLRSDSQVNGVILEPRRLFVQTTRIAERNVSIRDAIENPVFTLRPERRP